MPVTELLALIQLLPLEYSNDNGSNWINASSSVTGTAVSHIDGSLTSSNTIHFRVTNTTTSNSGTAATQLITINTTAPTVTVTIDGITDDTGGADFITSDNDGLTIAATLSGTLGTNEILEYSNDNGSNWINASSSVTGTAVSHIDAGLTSSNTIHFRVTNTTTSNSGTAATQLITINTTAPTVTVSIDGITDDTGGADFITSDNDGLTIAATLSGTLGTNEILEYSNDNGSNWINVSSSVTGIAVSHTDAGLTSSNTIHFRVTNTTTSNSGTAATQLITINTTAPTVTVSIDGITDDTGGADFITSDNDGLTIAATLSGTLGTNEILSLLYSKISLVPKVPDKVAAIVSPSLSLVMKSAPPVSSVMPSILTVTVGAVVLIVINCVAAVPELLVVVLVTLKCIVLLDVKLPST